MTTIAEILPRLVEFHAPVYYKAPLFSSRGRAAIVAETLRKILAAAHPRLSDSRFVTTEGKGAGCTVFIPRLQHTWNPVSNNIEAEIVYVVAELSKELGI